jgi:hypothetical protein
MITAKQRNLTPAIFTAARAVLLAQTLAEYEREEADKRYNALLGPGGELEGLLLDKRTGEIITHHKDVWRTDLDDQLYQSWRTRCDELNREAGHDIPPDYCPALMAEETLRQAHHVLIEAYAEIIPGVSVDGLLLAGLDTYKRFIDLAMKAAINHPDFEPPTI